MSGKKVLVTGASRGIGSACAVLFARQGYDVIVNYHQDSDSAQAVLSRCRKAGNGRFVAYQADVASPEAVHRMFSDIGEVDVLVNNAAVSSQQLFQDLPETEWDRMFAVNVKGAFLCCREAIPAMIQKKKGSIVNLSSVWGLAGASCEVCYSATKAAVIGMTKALAKELGPSGIRVNCVAPGVVRTDMAACFAPEVLDVLADESSLGRIATPEEIAQAVLFLSEDSASFVTGAVLRVDGGFGV